MLRVVGAAGSKATHPRCTVRRAGQRDQLERDLVIAAFQRPQDVIRTVTHPGHVGAHDSGKAARHCSTGGRRRQLIDRRGGLFGT